MTDKVYRQRVNGVDVRYEIKLPNPALASWATNADPLEANLVAFANDRSVILLEDVDDGVPILKQFPPRELADLYLQKCGDANDANIIMDGERFVCIESEPTAYSVYEEGTAPPSDPVWVCRSATDRWRRRRD